MKTTALILLLITSVFSAFMLSCQKEASPGDSGTSSSWVTDSTLLPGTTWTMYQYRDDVSTNIIPRNDTLIFLSGTTYTWNGIQNTYQLCRCNNPSACGTGYLFTLNNTPFGTLNAILPSGFSTYGEINDEPFDEYGSNVQRFYMWYLKL